MPNHVTSKITVSGPAEDVAAFKALMIREEPTLYGQFHADPALRGQPTGETETIFDFGRIIPRPEILERTEESGDSALGLFALGVENSETTFGFPAPNPLTYPWVKDLGIETREQMLAWLEKERPEAIAAAKTAIEAKKLTGHTSWYPWSIANWGTKWNAYSFQLHEEAPGRLVYTHDTAWSFPEPVYDALSERFPTLRICIACFDECSCFAGRGAYNAGPDDQPFEIVDATDSIYEEVYGHPPERFDDEEPEAGPATA
jgi:hypothetical protein